MMRTQKLAGELMEAADEMKRQLARMHPELVTPVAFSRLKLDLTTLCETCRETGRAMLRSERRARRNERALCAIFRRLEALEDRRG